MTGNLPIANLIVQALAKAGVTHVFGVPGAKIDGIFNALRDHPAIKLIVCRHEQNAAFMAAAVGRLTGRPGICLVTSGPGTTNLVTGLATATSEGDPVVAITGTVSRTQGTRHTHQNLDVAKVLDGVCKSIVKVVIEDQVHEVLANVFRDALDFPQGATALALPVDLVNSSVGGLDHAVQRFEAPVHGPASPSAIATVSELLSSARRPVVLLGMRAADPETVAATQRLVSAFNLPVVETFQAAGAISEDLLHLFYGRIGLFRNQPGDKLLCHADLILSVGYDPYEYDAEMWNTNPQRNKLIHVDYLKSNLCANYAPTVELVGDIATTLDNLRTSLQPTQGYWADVQETLTSLRAELTSWQDAASKNSEGLVQPQQFVYLLRKLLPNDTVVTTDVGTVYIYMMRYFYTYRPRHLLCSNGQQTLGVGLPWAIAASFVQKPPCSKRVVSVSGDGGFMFTSQELATAVQNGCKITHFILNDSAYNMVEFQEEAKYGRSSGIELGGVDFVKFAEAFGATGFRVTDSKDLEDTMKAALEVDGVAIVDIAIDYSHSADLMREIIPQDYH
ncbi:acetolactate synthase [Pochonia chlamydosporia 170]|uniref:Acetolactate synthase n=1 Tax=Pochonia chlamydosporia 170 TaxID=1380566 RepID=A0A179F537_METCM|nr:acetolactate synthase [Pochonia chlamydosporia 170]OAQ60537.1 acetolactate synthase [Pochonia chlamydosporia 170]